MQTSMGHASHYSHIVQKTPVLQYGHATALKVLKQALKERRPSWLMQISYHWLLRALQCGHATAIKVSKQAPRERRPRVQHM